MLAFPHIPSMLHKTVITAVERMIPTMAVTTADVAASPTAEALRPHCMPRMQPASATITPNTKPEKRPMPRFQRPTAFAVSL